MNPSIGSTIIIEGFIHDKGEEKEIIPGLLISAAAPNSIDSYYDFKIVIQKENEEKYRMRFVTPGVTLTQVENSQGAASLKKTELFPVRIHDFYYIYRIRLTTQPVNDYEIKYL